MVPVVAMAVVVVLMVVVVVKVREKKKQDLKLFIIDGTSTLVMGFMNRATFSILKNLLGIKTLIIKRKLNTVDRVLIHIFFVKIFHHMFFCSKILPKKSSVPC